MADIELKHSAKGSTWQKKGASYISRVKKNGKWVYTYASNKAGQAGRAVSTGASKVANTVSTAAGNANRSVRSAVASSKVNPDVMSTRIRKKTRNNVAKGKARVNDILKRLRGTAKKTKRKIKNAVSVKETAYITDVSTGKRRPAPTDLFENATTAKRSVSFTPRKKKKDSDALRAENKHQQEYAKKTAKKREQLRKMNKRKS